MSEKIPFDENYNGQFNNLPVPDEEQSWQKMKALLDKEEDRKPLFFLWNWLGGALLLIALATGGYFIFSHQENTGKNTRATTGKIETDVPGEKHPSFAPSPQPGKMIVQEENEQEITTAIPPPKTRITLNPKTSAEIREDRKRNINESRSRDILNNIKDTHPAEAKTRKSIPGKKLQFEELKTSKKQKDLGRDETELKKDKKIIEPPAERSPGNPVTFNEPQLDSIPLQSIPAADSLLTDSIQTEEKPEVSDSLKARKNKSGKFYFTAGLGIQQQIPLGGHDSVPYDSYGRKISVSDYIPSVFFRLHKENKWFIMGEFRYGAPQNLNEFSYNRKTIFDPASMNLSTTTLKLKKTYYHQLPLSFNYYLLPGWSIGLGGMYSRFYGAVREKEITSYNLLTQDFSYSKETSKVRGYTDSFFYKTQVHVILNTDFQYKNFMLGLRYTKDVQPYIKYTTPDGMINEEKNYSLQVIFRWQAWKGRD